MAAKKSVQLSGVVVAQTSICSIDAERGILMYRGYDIADLAEHATYEEVAYLLLEGELPSGEQLAAFREELSARELPPATAAIVDGRAQDAAPMEMLRTAVSSLSFSDPAEAAIDRANERRKAAQLIAQLPTIVARYHRVRHGLDPIPPDPSLSYAENFLTMLRGESPTEQEVRAFDVAMILHAEHEMNASTFAARVVAGTLADLHSAVVAAICALKGPIHGGANEKAMAFVEEIGSPEAAADAVSERFARKETVYGFGHPLYVTMDPARRDPQALVAGALGGRRRAELVRDHGRGRARGDGAEAAVAERRSLLGPGLRVPRHPDGSVHAALRMQPRRGPGGARARAARGQQDHPSGRRVRRPGAAELPGRVAELNLAEAAAHAQELAEAGDERAIADLRREWEDEVEGAARDSDYRVRAVAYRAIGQFRYRQKLELLQRGLEDESPACRGSALVSLELLSRDSPGVVNGARRTLHELVERRPEPGRPAPRDRLPEERLAGSRDDRASRGLGGIGRGGAAASRVGAEGRRVPDEEGERRG